MPTKEKNNKPSKASSVLTAPRRVQQPIDVKDDNYRLKVADIIPLSKEVNPSHVIVKDVSGSKEEEEQMVQQSPKPLKKSQFPPLTETKPDPSLPSTSAWAEPLPKEVLQAPMRETSNQDGTSSSAKTDSLKENKEPVVPTKDGPIPKTQAVTSLDNLKESTPPSSPPWPATKSISKKTEKTENNYQEEVEVEEVEEVEEEEEEEEEEEAPKPLLPSEFPPLPSTDNTKSNPSSTTIIPSNVNPAIPTDSVWINPIPEAITTPDPVVRTLEKEPEIKSPVKEEKKQTTINILVIPTKDGPLTKSQLLPQGEREEDQEDLVEKVKEKTEVIVEKTKEKTKEKIEETKKFAKEKKEQTKGKLEETKKLAKENIRRNNRTNKNKEQMKLKIIFKKKQ